MLQRLAMSLGFSDQLRHIETVTATGAELQANPVMAIILGSAGLTGYAQDIQNLISLPIIDSATAGLEVLVNQQAPMPTRKGHGTYAQWMDMSESIERLSPNT
jgi:Asp/Glu/hydantoin racemase